MLAALLHACASMGSGPELDSLAFKRTALDRSAVEMKPDEAREYARWALPFARVAGHVYCKTFRRPILKTKKMWTARRVRNSVPPAEACCVTGVASCAGSPASCRCWGLTNTKLCTVTLRSWLIWPLRKPGTPSRWRADLTCTPPDIHLAAAWPSFLPIAMHASRAPWLSTHLGSPGRQAWCLMRKSTATPVRFAFTSQAKRFSTCDRLCGAFVP